MKLRRYWSKSKQQRSKEGEYEFSISYTEGVYSFNIDITVVRDRGKWDGWDLRLAIMQLDAYARWTRDLPKVNYDG